MSKFLYCQMEKASAAIRKLVTRKEEGASLVEYGLLVALIACACIVAITATGTSISGIFNYISGKVDTAAGS